MHVDGPSAPIFCGGRGSIFPARVITGNGVALIGVHFLVCCMSLAVYYFPSDFSRSLWRCCDRSGGADAGWDVASAGGGVSGKPKPNLHHSVSPSLLHSSSSPDSNILNISSPSPLPPAQPPSFLTLSPSISHSVIHKALPASLLPRLSHPLSISHSFIPPFLPPASAQSRRCEDAQSGLEGRVSLPLVVGKAGR